MKDKFPITPLSKRMASVEQVSQQLRGVPKGQTQAEQLVRLRQACVRLSAPILADLYRFFQGRISLTREQLTAAEMVLKRSVPQLQTLYHEEVKTEQPLDEKQVLARMEQLMGKYPELIDLAQKARERAIEGECYENPDNNTASPANSNAERSGSG